MHDVSEALRSAIRYATLAPSGHNTQPWGFRLGTDDVELWADRTRSLPLVDPDDRELIIACGAALHHLCTALVAASMAIEVEVLPEPLTPDLLARVVVTGAAAPDPTAERWLFAMTRRHTTRTPFEARTPCVEVLQDLQRVSRAHGAELRIIPDRHRRSMLDMIARADRQQGESKSLRRELASWLRGNHTRQRDGIPGFALGRGALQGALARFAVRRLNWGDSQAARDRALAARSPVLAVLETPSDGPAAWIAAGQALSAVLLEAAAAGLSASFLNQAIEIPSLRTELASLVAPGAYPQLMLRLGYHRGAVAATPRRPIDELLI